MLNVVYTKLMLKDFKRIKKRHKDMSKLQTVLDILVTNQKLPSKYKDHALIGNYKGFRECHIEPNWLLIYKIDGDELVLLLSRTGSHSDLFK